jgi:hypothetical protein
MEVTEADEKELVGVQIRHAQDPARVLVALRDANSACSAPMVQR